MRGKCVREPAILALGKKVCYMDVDRLIGYLPQALGDAGFKAAAYFGSVARGTYDEYSDVDMIVCSGGLPPENFINNLTSEFGKTLFRPFSSTVDGKLSPQCGRYWFNNLNPFCKIDVSFHDENGFKRVIRNGSDFVSGPYEMIMCHASNKSHRKAHGLKQVDLPPDVDFYKWLRLAKVLHRGRELDLKDRELLWSLTYRITKYLKANGFSHLGNSVSRFGYGARYFTSTESQGGAA
jgi:predicted nucleotidyltransferase